MEALFLLHVRGGEGLLVWLSDDGGLVVLIRLPEDDADLVVGEVFAREDFDLLVGVALGPAFVVALLDPGAVGVGDAVAFVAERFRLLLELLAGLSFRSSQM